MSRILARLAAFNFFVLLLTFAVGWLSRGRESLKNIDDPTFTIHFYLGLFAVLLTLAVHCLIFIYFLGTGRWVKEVAIAYRLPDAPLPRLTRDLKRRTFPVALLAMLVPIAAAAAGTAAQRQEWSWKIHAWSAAITLLVNLWAFIIEYRNVSINAGVIDNVMREVDRIRSEHGLPSNAEAIQAENPKSEIRNPKEISNTKSEIQTPSPER
ncbi:MAG TPA: hypothetical protein VN688_33040 [Gemmataceae bacterium]|nr:hypothetical protein [Gemmataceae bacterium]